MLKLSCPVGKGVGDGEGNVVVDGAGLPVGICVGLDVGVAGGDECAGEIDDDAEGSVVIEGDALGSGSRSLTPARELAKK